jgi:diacylglycerol diphosphate phosphatase/phosphatidate phosphatase
MRKPVEGPEVAQKLERMSSTISSALVSFFITQGYLYDWLASGLLLLISLLVPCAAIKPVIRFYNTTDPTLSYPLENGTISSTLLYVLVFAPPIVSFLLFYIYNRVSSSKDSTTALVDLHHALLSVLESFSLATCFKRWMNLVGVLRPHTLAVFAGGDPAEIQDTRQSYPSGHSAYMFSTSALLTLYLLGHLKVISKPRAGNFGLAFICLLPLILATFVALTRIYDYKHAPADVNAGCFVGILSSVFSYVLNFHSISDQQSDKPRQRTQGKENKGYSQTAADQEASGSQPLATAQQVE